VPQTGRYVKLHFVKKQEKYTHTHTPEDISKIESKVFYFIWQITQRRRPGVELREALVMGYGVKGRI
jgi:hypothetical protein